MIRPIVIGTHEYEWAVCAFAWLCAKYWRGQDITYIGDHLLGILPGNVTFMQVPSRSEGIWRWENWFGDGLLSIFEKYKDDLIVLFLPDHWLTAPVDVERVESLGRYMELHTNIVRGNLTADQPMYAYGRGVDVWDDSEIWSMSINGPYAAMEGGLTFCPSMWNPRLALNLIEKKWTLWECEDFGTNRMRDRFPYMYSVGIHPAPIHRAHTLYHAQKRTVHLSRIQEEDRSVIRQYIPPNWRIV